MGSHCLVISFSLGYGKCFEIVVVLVIQHGELIMVDVINATELYT